MYIISEAYRRFDDDVVVDLWSLISKVLVSQPKLMVAVHQPDNAAIVRITLVAWQRRHAHIRRRCQQRHCVDLPNEPESPPYILEFRREYDLPEVIPIFTPDATASEPVADAGQLLPPDFDFDSIDWSFWENSNLDAALFETDW